MENSLRTWFIITTYKNRRYASGALIALRERKDIALITKGLGYNTGQAMIQHI